MTKCSGLLVFVWGFPLLVGIFSFFLSIKWKLWYTPIMTKGMCDKKKKIPFVFFDISYTELVRKYIVFSVMLEMGSEAIKLYMISTFTNWGWFNSRCTVKGIESENVKLGTLWKNQNSEGKN